MKSRFLYYTTTLGAAIATLAPVVVYANPEDGVVAGGSATFEQNGKTLTINQSSNKAIIDWRSFDINSDETTEFKQPSSSSIALNRIKDNKPSQIAGTLKANGNIILINPNGVVFTGSAKVDVNSLAVTSSDTDNDEFINQQQVRFNKPGNLDAKIINQGQITAKEAGLVGFVAPHLENSGVITAKLGTVHLATGDTFTLDMAGDGLTSIAATGDIQKSLIENSGTIDASGGQIHLTAMAARGAVENIITNSGTLKANSFAQKNGKIYLYAPGSKGKIQNSGIISATGKNPGQRGGQVSITAKKVTHTGKIDVSGDIGGLIGIDADAIEHLGETLADGATGNAGDVMLNFKESFSDSAESKISAKSDAATGGRIILNGDVESTIDAAGIFDVSGASGGEIAFNAKNITLNGGRLLADAISGKAGKISLNAEKITNNGTISANSLHGAGGNISIDFLKNYEDSSLTKISASSEEGQAGSILIEGKDEATLTVSGTYIANGITAGDIDLLAGGNINLVGAVIQARGRMGGGRIRIGGEYQGKGNTRRARQVWIDTETDINADAIYEGNGGRIIVWADDATFFEGHISARGGANGGDGGFVETSGHNYLSVTGMVDAAAPNGKAGQWLLDPADLTVTTNTNGNTSTSGTNPITYQTSAGGAATLDVATVNAALNAGTSVIIMTSSAGSGGNGDITVSSAITTTGTGSLTISAYRNLTVSANITLTSGNLVLQSNNADVGTGFVNVTGTITTTGGNVTLGGGSNMATGYAYGNSANATTKNGVYVSGAISLGSGSFTARGNGGGYTSGNIGVSLGGAITTTGAINITGVGGSSGTTGNYGVQLSTNVTTGSGANAINLTGSSTTGTNNYGLVLVAGTIGGASYTGAITINATGLGFSNGGTVRTNNNAIDFGTTTNLVGSGTYQTTNYAINFTGTVGSVNTSTIMTTNAAVSITSNTGGVTTASITTSGAYNVSVVGSAGNVSIGAATTGSGTITLTSSTGSVTATGALTTSGAAINVTGATSVTLASISNAGAALNVTAQGGGVTTTTIANGTTAGSDITLKATTFISTGAVTGKTITMQANSSDGNAAGNYIYVNGTLTSAGNVVLGGGSTLATGYAYGSNATNTNSGVRVVGNISTGGGSFTARGIGGALAGGSNYGVYLQSNTGPTITGGVTLTGTGGSAGNSNYGVYLGGGIAGSTGSATITLTGTAGSGTSNYGVYNNSNTIGGGSYTGSIAVDASGAGLYLAGGLTTSNNTITFGSTTNISGGGSLTTTNNAISFTGTTGSIVMGAISTTNAAVSMVSNTGGVTTGSVATTGSNNITITGSGGAITTTSVNAGAGAISITGSTSVTTTTLTSSASAISVTAQGGNVTTTTITTSSSGTSPVSLKATGYISTGAITGSSITAQANSGDANSGGYVNVGSLTTSNGDIALGGGSGFTSGNNFASGYAYGTSSNLTKFGVSAGTISAGNGNVIMRGIGGTYSVGSNFGVYLTGSLTTTGNVTLTGTGGTASTLNYGVASATGVSINGGTGSGTITIVGTGGTGASNYGVYNFNGTYGGASYTGNMIITGTEGGIYSAGTFRTTGTIDISGSTNFAGSGAITAGSGAITLNATTGTTAIGAITTANSAVTITNSVGAVTTGAVTTTGANDVTVTAGGGTATTGAVNSGAGAINITGSTSVTTTTLTSSASAISVTAQGGNVTTTTITTSSSGTSPVSLKATGYISTGAITGSSITAQANSGDANSGGYVNVGSLTTSNGDIALGGGSGFTSGNNFASGYAYGSNANGTQFGVAAGAINAGSGNVTMRGTGGAYTSGSNFGVYLTGALASTGNVTLTGIGGSAGTLNYGVASGSAANINGGTGSGTIIINGTGGTGSSNYGAYNNNATWGGASYTGNITINGAVIFSAGTIRTSGVLSFGTSTNIVGGGVITAGNTSGLSFTGTTGSINVGAITITSGAVSFVSNTGGVTTGAISTSSGAVTVTGTGGSATTGAITTTGANDVTVTAGSGAVSVGAINAGAGAISLTGSTSVTATTLTSTAGSITATAQGGNVTTTTISTSSSGTSPVFLKATGYISTGAITGSSITAQANSGDANSGGFVSVGVVTTGGGNVALGGGSGFTSGNNFASGYAYGASTSGTRYGVYVDTITANGGNVVIRGTGGSYASGTNYGVYNYNPITTTGTINITGVGGTASNNNYGIASANNAHIGNSAGSAAITLTGTGGSGTSAYGIYLGAYVGGTSFTGAITINANSDGLSGGVVRTNNNTIDFGTTTNIVNNATIQTSGNAINFTGTTGSIALSAVTTSGAAINIASNTGSVSTGAITTTNGGITVTASGGAVSTFALSTSNGAINLTGSTSVTTTTVATSNAAISMTAQNGNISTTSVNAGTSGTAPVTLTATGYVSTTGLTGSSITVQSNSADANSGGYIYVNGAITTVGNIILGGGSNLATGYAYGSSTNGANRGIRVTGAISAGSGSITARGIGGNYNGQYNVGVDLASSVTTTGAVTLVGIGGSTVGTNNGGIHLNSGITALSGSAAISMNGTAGVGSGSYGLNTGGTIGGASYTGNITFAVNSIYDSLGAFTTSGTGTITVKNDSSTTGVGVGTGAGGLSLGDTLLNRFTVGTSGKLIIGDSSTGNIDINTTKTFAFPVTFITGSSGDILLNGNIASSMSSGNSLIFASGRKFTNGGTNTITAGTGTARWIIYSADPANDTNGGLSAAQTIYAKTYGTLDPTAITTPTYNATQNTWVYASAAPAGTITITASNQTVTYGTAPNLTPVLNTNYTFSCSDGCSSSVISGLLLGITGATTSTSGNYNVGTWTISGSGASASNGYTINYVTGTLTVNQKGLTVTGITAGNKVYDANTVATLNTASASLSGLVTNDVVSLSTASAAGAFTNANVGNGKTVNVSGLSISGTDYLNYSLTQPTTTANITPASLSITAENKSMTYGSSVPSYTYTSSGLLGSDNISGVTISDNATTSTSGNKNAGTWTLTASNASGTGLSNYDITYNTGTLNIAQKALTITGVEAISKTYDASTDATIDLSLADFSGLVANDIVELGGTATGTFNNANVGNGKTVTTSGFTISGADYANYSLSQPTTTANITAASLTITAGNKSMTYGGSVPSYTYTSSGLLGSDNISGVTISDNATTSTSGNKNAGTWTLTASSASGTGLSNYNITYQTGTLNIAQKALSITGVTANNKTYDTNNTASLNLGSAALSGLVTNDVVSLDSSSATGTFSDANVGTGKTVTTTGFSISGTDYANYSLSQPTTTANITAASLTITAANKSMTYAGSVPSYTYSSSGLLSGDSISGVTIVDDATTSTSGNKNAGTWTLTASNATGTGLGNYNITYQTGTLNIAQKALTITGVTANNKTYNGTNTASLNLGSAALSGLVTNDVVSLDSSSVSGTFSDANVGTGKTVTTTGFSISGTDYANYSLSQPTTTANITTASLTIKAEDKSVTYGNSFSNSVSITSGALYGSDSVSSVSVADNATLSTSGNKNAGTWTLTASNATGTGLSNYNITYDTGVLTIAKKALTITGVTADNKVYDSTNTASLNLGSAALSGLITNDVVNLDSSSVTGTFANANVGNGKTVTTNGFSISGTDYDNYSLSQPTTTANITAASLTITAQNKSMTYGDSLPTYTYGASGLLGSDNISGVTITDDATTSTSGNKNAGTWTLTASNATGSGLSNYNITYNDGTLSIAQKALTITGVTADNKVYDSTNTASLSFGSAGFNGLIINDVVNLDTSNAVSTFANANVGNNKAVTISGLDINGTDSANYTISQPSATANITAAALTITAANKSMTYGGTNPTFTYNVSGLLGSDAVNGVTLSTDATTSGAGSYNAGTWTISASVANGTGLSNYDITYTDGTLTVNKAALTVAADNKSKIYGAANPSFTYSVSGLVNGDTSSVFSGATLGTIADATSNTGTYAINLTGGSASNYDITRNDGTLTINAATLTITANDKSKVYGATLPTFDGVITGLVNGDTASSALTGAASYTTTATNSSNVGNYTITAGQGTLAANNNNYVFTTVNGDLDITKAQLTVTADNKTMTYGAGNSSFTSTITGFVNGDTASVVTGSASHTTNATTSGAGSYNAGTWSITPAAGTLAASNYDFSYVAGSLTVNKAALTVTAENKNKTYNKNSASDQALTYTYTGLVNGDSSASFTGGLTRASGENAGSYQINQGNLAATGNYIVTGFNAGSFVIDPATLNITANNKTKSYGAVNPSLTYTYSGLISGDSITGALDTAALTGSPLGDYAITQGTLDAGSNYNVNFTSGILTIAATAIDTILYEQVINTIEYVLAPIVTYNISVINDPNPIKVSNVSKRGSKRRASTEFSSFTADQPLMEYVSASSEVNYVETTTRQEVQSINNIMKINVGTFTLINSEEEEKDLSYLDMMLGNIYSDFKFEISSLTDFSATRSYN